MSERQITGRQVFAVTAGAFAVIIAVNLTLAWQAVATFPGLEVRNSYVASQSFDDDRARQLALGWQVSASLSEGRLVLSIEDESGQPVRGVEIASTFGRATNVAEDRTPDFAFDGRDYVADVGAVGIGNWNLRLAAIAPDGTPFRQRIPIHVRAE